MRDAGPSRLPDDPNAPRNHSNAFELFVVDADDLEGLLAYALYKRSVREEALEGRWRNGRLRDPSAAALSAFREAAGKRLQALATAAIDAATSQIVENDLARRIDGLGADLRNQGDRIMARVDKRTAPGSAVLWNVVAWIVSIALTALVLTSLAQPNIGQRIADVFRVGPPSGN